MKQVSQTAKSTENKFYKRRKCKVNSYLVGYNISRERERRRERERGQCVHVQSVKCLKKIRSSSQQSRVTSVVIYALKNIHRTVTAA